MQPVENPLSKSVLNGDQGARAELAQLFGADKPITKATTEDQLVNRQVFYWGLPQDRRDELAERIRLIETLKLKQKDGTEKTVPLLHNGYLMGGGDTAMDCSSFVSSVLPASVRKGSYTTLDFKAMYTLLRSGQIEVPPKYKKNREAWIRKVAQSFEALDLYDGAKPRQADLLVYRSEIAEAGNKGPAFGHVFLVEEFNSKRLQATVIEASQSATTLRRRPFDLSVTPMNKKVRPIRPGLMLLRLRNPGVQSCSVGGGKT